MLAGARERRKPQRGTAWRARGGPRYQVWRRGGLPIIRQRRRRADIAIANGGGGREGIHDEEGETAKKVELMRFFGAEGTVKWPEEKECGDVEDVELSAREGRVQARGAPTRGSGALTQAPALTQWAGSGIDRLPWSSRSEC